jgi:2-dehydropantoate 2-reductase
LERFEVGTFPSNASAEAKAQTQRFSDIFTAGGGNCPVFDDIQTKRWPKLAVNCAWNPVTALTLCDDANYLRSSDLADDMIVKIMRQVGDVARAAGYEQVTEEVIQDSLKLQRGRVNGGGKEPSMLTDIKNRRPIEVDAIIGNTVRIARKFSVDVPYLELLYALAKGLNFSTVRTSEWRPLLKFD